MGTGYMNHQSWQGKVYSSAEMRTVCGLGEMLGFAGSTATTSVFLLFLVFQNVNTQMSGLWSRTGKRMKRSPFMVKSMIHMRRCSISGSWNARSGSRNRNIKLLEKARADKDDLTAARCRKRLNRKDLVLEIFKGYGPAAAEGAVEGWRG